MNRDQLRFDAFMRTGCIVTRLYFNAWGGFDVHHLTAGYRLGHQSTIPLTPWYHRGVVPSGLTQKEAEALFGPSLARSKREFVKRFGTELFLLNETNKLINSKNIC